jgi:hypothetical protein
VRTVQGLRNRFRFADQLHTAAAHAIPLSRLLMTA